MILVFPSLDAYRLALTAGFAPPELTTAPATVSTDAGGRLFVETDAKLTKKVRDELDRLGVTASKRHPAPAEAMTCWLQVVPLTRDAAPPRFSKETPVLFELPAIADLPTFVGEMLRLGNDRQSFRIVADATGHAKPLLRVIGPPYYTLLRAIDKFADAGESVRAYVEAAPRVWVEVGHTHPMAAKITPAEGQLVLLRGPREWTFLADEPFRDVYELLNLQLPTTPAALHAAAIKGKVTVPLRLAAGNAADRAELWVVRGSATDSIDTLVRDADDRLIEQLRFAVATTAAGERVIVLRTVPSKKEPPALPLDAVTGFKPFWKLPNLYVPAGTRLHPTIRRDAVRTLLAPDPDQLVWLFPGANGTFTPEIVAENSFRPLADWVEYIIDTARAPLAEWIASATFAFDSFICTDAGPAKPKPPPDRRDPKGEKQPAMPIPEKKDKAPKTAEPTEPTAFEPPAEVKPPSAWRVRRDELEAQFLAANEPLDGPTRIALWPQLATANAGIGDSARDDAAVCWVNALWTTDPLPRDYIRGWVRSERPDAELAITPAAFDKLMAATVPTPGEVRAFASTLLWVATENPPSNWLRQRLPAVQKYLETHDRALPVRAVWLVASHLAALGGADVLGLARVRDRILQRLLEEGLSPERDLPGFLRFAGLANSERVRTVRERVGELHRVARGWTEKSLKKATAASATSDVKCTLAYTDLMFAFGLARLGEPSAAQTLVAAAKPTLVVPRPLEPKDKENVAPFAGYVVSGFLFQAYQDRIEAGIAGKPHTGQLRPAVIAEFESIQKKVPAAKANVINNPYGMAVYVINRWREQSKILEPQERMNPYATWMYHADELKKVLAELPSLKDPAAIARTLRDLLQNGVKGRPVLDTRFLVLHAGLPLAARVGEAFAVELLAQVPDAIRTPPTGPPTAELALVQGQLFERALFLAAHFDRTEEVQNLVNQFVEYVHGKPDEQRYTLVNIVAGQCLKSLRKLGLRDEIDKLLRRTQDEILKGKTLPLLKTQYASRPEVWLDALQTLLNLAAGYLTFGLTDQAVPILDTARAELAAGGGKVSPPIFTRLAQTYVTAVGHAPAEAGLARILDLYGIIDPARVTSGWTTAPYYSRLHLNLIEDTVLAICGDEFGLGSAGRKWLDEDELLVRRRVHADMRRHLAAGGL